MKFIIGTTLNNAKVFINAEKICAIYPNISNKDETVVQFDDEENYLIILESTETIMNLILNEVEE